ncbi:IS110 family transposase [Tabrizicola sp.]|uniref:IS110 family transposase n=1 Tax=Tabrizicola sp. TaxID=2005166 RepID=UPI003F2B279D
MTQTHIGVDISKDMLDIFDPRCGHRRIANTTAGIRRWLCGIGTDSFLVFEATSRCDKHLVAGAAAAKIPFVRINPLHGWHFAQSLNLPKTDRIDARMLARFGAERYPEPTLPADPARSDLAALSQRRDQLKRMETQEKNRLQDTSLAILQRDLRASLKALAVRITRIDALIRDHLRAHPQLAGQAKLLRSIPGIGPVTAVEMLAHLPQLGTVDRRSIASLGGLAPKARESGKFKGKRVLGPGRRHVRRCLYMAALAALRHPHLFGNAAARMRVAGKPGKVIVIAIARKIITIANAVLRDQTPFATA